MKNRSLRTLSAALGLLGAATAQVAPVNYRAVTTPDGSRFLLVATGGAPVVHWTVCTPAGPLEDPPGLEGLAHAVARAALAGPLSIGSRDTEREKEALDHEDKLEQEFARGALAGTALPPEFLEQLETARSDARVLSDTSAFELEVRKAPALASELVEAEEASLWHLTLGIEGVPRVATLVWLAREDTALRGVHEEFRRVRAEARERITGARFATARDEVLAQHYLGIGHPYGRANVAATQPPQPLSRQQALLAYRATHHPTRSFHVLCGGFAIEKVEPILQRVFVKTSLRETPRAPLPALRELDIERRSTLPRARESGAVLAWRIPGQARSELLEGLVDWLAEGQDSWLARGLRKEGQPALAVTGVPAFPGRVGEGLMLFEIGVDPSSERGPFAVEPVVRAARELLEAAAKDGPSPDDQLRVVSALRARHGSAASSPRGLALDLALRCGILGEPASQVLAPVAPSADELRLALRALLDRSRPAVVLMEAGS